MSRFATIRGVVLVGLRASGKTTLGRALAGRLGWPFVDTDAGIAAAAGRPAGELLAAVGEAAFRTVETEVVGAVLGRSAPPRVVALGGGALGSPAVCPALRRRYLVAWLDAPDAILAARWCAAPVMRPPLTDNPPIDEVRALRRLRQARYRAAADLRLETFPANVDACCARLLAMIVQWSSGP